MKIHPHEYEILLRSDLSTFFERCFADIAPGSTYLYNWHISLIAHHLERCRLGLTKRLIINIPPRNMKSICASVAFTAWLLGHNPRTQIIAASYGQELATKHARDTRAIMQSSWYQKLFPTRLNPKQLGIDNFATTQKGGRLATSVGGVITGLGADFIILDDPLKPEEAMSETSRNKTNEWFDSTLYSRLNNKTNGCIIIIMQRLHEDDIVGHVLEQEEWEIVRLPAIAQTDETHHFLCPVRGPQVVYRRQGEALHPAREPLHVLESLRQRMGTFNFAGQYQQIPAPAEGALVKREWLRFYSTKPVKFDRIIQSWDTANKVSELCDYSVCTTWGMLGKNVYLLHVMREKLEFPDLKRKVASMMHAYSTDLALIEDRASGTQLIQELQREGWNIQAISPENDKVMRMHTQTPMFENGRVYLPESAPWLDPYIHEICTFPSSKHNDQVDSTTQALTWMNQAAHYGDQFRIRVI